VAVGLVLVGLGRMAIGNQELAGGLPLSHADAALAAGGFEISGLVDLDVAKRGAAAAMFPGVPLADRLESLPANAGEVIVISASTGAHADLAMRALARNPAVVVVEKPMAADLDSAIALAQSVEAAGAELRVNFHRRFDPRHRHWHDRRPQLPRLIEMRYGKGLLNYASHMVDWLLDWYGEIDSVRALPLRVDESADPSPSFVCVMAAGFEAVVLGVAGLDYDQFEIDILANGERLRLADGGAEISRETPRMAKHYAGYAHLVSEIGSGDTAPVGGFVELYRAIRVHCQTGVPLSGCDHRIGLLNMAVLEAIRLSHNRGGEEIRPRDLLQRSWNDVTIR
jgi:predicted dehydrogenase